MVTADISTTVRTGGADLTGPNLNASTSLGTVAGPASSATTALVFVACTYFPDATAKEVSLGNFGTGNSIMWQLPAGYLSGVTGEANPSAYPLCYMFEDPTYTTGKTYDPEITETGATTGGSVGRTTLTVVVPGGVDIPAGTAPPVGALSVFVKDSAPTPGCQYEFTITETGATTGGEVTDIVAETD